MRKIKREDEIVLIGKDKEYIALAYLYNDGSSISDHYCRVLIKRNNKRKRLTEKFLITHIIDNKDKELKIYKHIKRCEMINLKMGDYIG
jgi:hypothetical protein